jgi:hypothetical protein
MATADEADSILSTVDRAARTTRAVRPTRALPLLVLALVVVGAMPFYVLDLDRPEGTYEQSQMLWSLGGFLGTSAGVWTAVYWIVTLPLAYAFIAWWHHRAARRNGVASHVRWLVLTGVLLFGALLVMLSQAAPGPLANLYIRGLTPIITMALGLLVWAIAERSRGLLVVALAFLASALLASLYDLVNMTYRLGIQIPDAWSMLPNLALCAAVLLVSAAVYAEVERRDRAGARG